MEATRLVPSQSLTAFQRADGWMDGWWINRDVLHQVQALASKFRMSGKFQSVEAQMSNRSIHTCCLSL